MHRKFDIRRYLTAFFVGIFAVVGSIVAIDAPAGAAIDSSCPASVTTVSGTASVDSTLVNGVCYVVFKNSGGVGTQTEITWTKPAGLNFAKVLVVAGGGGGGAHVGAGGGAGGLIDLNSVQLSNSSYSIKVGQGGRGAYTNSGGDVNQGPDVSSLSANGIDSAFGASYVAAGGGRGAAWWNPGAGAGESFTAFGNNNAGTGGSGGGAVRQSNTQVLGAASTQEAPGFGFAGGATGTATDAGFEVDGYLTGGGGGAGAVGGSASHASGSKKSGDGGVGRSVKWLPTAVATSLSVGQISSSVVFFAGGGGGGMHTKTSDNGAGVGGVGGGGNGAGPAQATTVAGEIITAASGVSASGGGGGGAGGCSCNSITSTGGPGGSGVVIISYVAANFPATDDNYMSFNGTNQYAGAAGAQVIPATGAFTVEAWINAASADVQSSATIFSQGPTGNRFYVKRSSGQLALFHDGASAELLNCGNLPAGEWVHIAVAVSGNNTYCFINGSLFSGAPLTHAFGSTSIGTGFYVGQYSAVLSNQNTFWKGGIDQVKVWNTAITDPALIARSMHTYQDQDASGYISGSASSRNLKSHFDFNESSASTFSEDKVASSNLTSTGSPTRASIVTTGTSGTNTTYSIPRTLLNAWGGWVSPITTTAANALVVAGGGGAGKSVTRNISPVGGSGGGGGVAVLSAQSLTSGTVYPVIVGQSGLGATSVADDASNRNGQTSKFLSTTVLGGGGGGSSTYAGAGGSTVATGGGGGGIAGLQCGSSTNGGGVASSGFNGGQGILSWGGAGGGAGGASPARNCTQEYGTSGPGVSSSITGASVEYGRAGFAGPAGSIPASNSNPGSGGSVSYGAATGDGSGYPGKSGLIYVSAKTSNAITFNGNSGTSTLAVQNIAVGSSANLLAATGVVTRTNYTFTGWNTAANGSGTAYLDSASITPSNDITLYAQWIPSSPVLYYNFSDRDSTHDGTTSVTNLGSNSSYSATKNGSFTTDLASGKLSFAGGSHAAGPFIDVADMSTTQFADNGITIDFEADFGSADLWERVLDFGAAAPGTVASNLLVGREGSTNNLWVEIYNDTASAGACKVVDGLVSAGFARWTISVDGVNCKIYKDGTAQTTFITTSNSTSSAWAGKVSSGVNWSSNFIGRSNWTPDANFAGTIRSLRLFAGVMTPSQVGAITYRTINFDANYTGASSLTSRYTSGKTTLQTAPTRSGYTFGGWYDNIVSTSGTLIGGTGAIYSPLSTPMNLFGAWAANVATPTISSHPADVTKSAGETATFSVSASRSDSGTLSYQWEVSANNGSSWGIVSGGTGATTSSYTTPTLVSADLGKQYRVVVTNTLSGATATATSNAATLTIGLDKINVNFDELNFDYANVSHIVGTNGKTQGNKVLFLNVTTKNGVQVDALVTTETLSGATITNYETGARAGGANSYFQTDVDFTASNGFAQFKFDFYKHGVTGAAGNPCTVANPTCTGATKVVIQNVNVSAIDIDYYQWNDFTQAESYTLAGNTKLKECAIPNSGTCTTRTAPSTFPADMRFQGSPDTARTNDPVDMAIVTYADIETFRIKFGRDRAGSPNYYGVAFKALDWGTATPQTKGSTDYTISYNANSPTSGSQAGTHVGAAGSTFTVLSAGTAVKTGYTFAGWATSSSATTADYAASSKVTMPGSNLTLYAVWTAVKYTLTYNVNGGTGAPAAGSFETGTNNVTLSSTVPTRTGYVFGGWDTVVNSGNGNTNYASGATYSMPSSNTTLYAKWTIANGTLAYNANSGTTTQASVTAAGNTTTTVANGSNTNRTGYDFAGWNSKADGTGTSYAVGSTFTLSANVTTTIYAQWTLSKYTLVFNVNGGVGTPQSQSYVQGATTTMPVSNPTRAGYNFAGWNSQADGNGTAYNGSFLMPGNDLTLYAKWNAITYNVTYNNNSATYSGATGTVTDATDYTAAQSVTVAAATGLSNTTGSVTYLFTGWNTSADGSGTDYMPSSTFSMPAGNRTLYAMWVDASIEIAYNANGGTNAPANANTTLNSTFTIDSTPPQRSGYTFAGWNVQDGNPGGGPHAAGSTITPNSNEVLVAQWTAVNYTVTFDTDGGSTAPSQQTNKNIGNTISITSSEPTKSGYTFLGWKDAAGNVYPAGGSFSLGAGSVTLTAQWQGRAFTLTYDANSGTAAPASETRNYNASANLSATQPTRTGYTFQGWNSLVGGTGNAYNASASYTMPNGNATLFAQWTANTYVFAYNTQGGSTAPSSSNKAYNASVSVSATPPNRTGFTFAGWNTTAAGTGTTYFASASFTMPDADVTLYAQWTKTAYTLYYNTNGGQGVFSSQPVKYSESVTVDSTAPTKTGYTFTGWNTAADGSGFDHTPRGVFTLNVESNVTLFAKWTAVSYTVTYSANTGSGAPTGGTHTFGASVTTASKGSMALTNYRFIGWNTRDDGSGTTYVEGASFNMPAENVILYAQWISSLYEIAYNANGGAGGPDGADVNDGTSYTVDSIQPVRPGYTFDGWKLADGTPTISTYKAGTATQTFTISGNEVLVAQWTIKTITVTYDLNAGTGTTPTAGSGNYNSNITLASSSGVTRSNFEFVGWSTTPDGTGTTYVDGSTFKLPAENVILYAKWAPVYYIIEYNAAGGSGAPADQFATPSSTVAIASQEPTKSGFEFDKWTEVSQGTDFNPGASLTMPSSNVVLVANYTVRAAGVPGSGSGSNTGVIDPNAEPISKPKQLVLSVYFKGDSPVLTTNTKIALKKLAATAKAYGRANNITIYGRVKETNDKSYDQRLSKARAANVAAFLKKYGVTGVFKVYAKGISPENTYKSRRVDMKLWWAK